MHDSHDQPYKNNTVCKFVLSMYIIMHLQLKQINIWPIDTIASEIYDTANLMCPQKLEKDTNIHFTWINIEKKNYLSIRPCRCIWSSFTYFHHKFNSYISKTCI